MIRHPSDGSVSGVDLDLVGALSSSVGLKLDFMRTRTWGGPGPNHSITGEWTGTTEAVRSGRAHVGFGSLVVSISRATVIKYSWGLYGLSAHLLVGPALPLASNLNIVRPFQLPVWMAFVSTILIIVATIVILGNLSKLWHAGILDTLLLAEKLVFGESKECNCH